MPSLPNSSDVDNSLIGILLNDPTLKGLMPDGVYYAAANPGAKRYVLVTLVSHVDLDTFGRREMEIGLYRVKAVALSTTGGDVNSAAHRIDQLLHDTTWPIGTGLELAASHRIDRMRDTERDDVDPDLLWNHRGGDYRVETSLV